MVVEGRSWKDGLREIVVKGWLWRDGCEGMVVVRCGWKVVGGETGLLCVLHLHIRSSSVRIKIIQRAFLSVPLPFGRTNPHILDCL